MSEVKDCPKCRLVNPPSAQRCDCGYDFITHSVQRSYLPTERSSRPDGGSRLLGLGCLVLAPLFLISGLLAAMKALGAGGDDAFVMGQVCGGLLPGIAALGMAAYLLRRSR